MKKLFLTTVVMLFSFTAQAQLPEIVDLSTLIDGEGNVSWDWQTPDTRNDGSGLLASEISMYPFWCATSAADASAIPDTNTQAFADKMNSIVSAPNFIMNQLNAEGIGVMSADRTRFDQAGTVPDVNGYYGCQIATVDTDGVTSEWSAHVTVPKFRMPARPAAPSGFGSSTGT